MNNLTSCNFGEEIHAASRLIHPNLMTRRKKQHSRDGIRRHLLNIATLKGK